MLAAAGGQCEVIVRGVRCAERDPAKLEAHHVRRLADGGANDAGRNGLCLCREHHRLLSRKAAA